MMNLITSLLPFLSILVVHAITPALADFYVYQGTRQNRWDTRAAWYISQKANINCDNALQQDVLLQKNDVSNDKYGVACDGRGCYDMFGAEEIERLEINAGKSSIGHLSRFLLSFPSVLRVLSK